MEVVELRERVLVTAALPYSYAPRHFGHLAGAYLPADIFARFKRMRGAEVIYVCGTDENASSIVIEAMRRGITPKELCDIYYPIQKEVFDRLGMSFDIFSRTSKPIHYEVVEKFYKRLWDKGYIYPRKVKQWWCPSCRIYLPDRFVIGTCPRCGAPNQYGDVCEVCGSWYESFELRDPRCSLCGARPEVRTKTHFFLKLSALADEVLEYVRGKRFWRKATYNKTVSWLEKEGLRDKDITRDYEWGPPAPFPGAEGQVIYNWAENLLGYISATRDWAISVAGDPERWRRFWLDENTKLYCFIGKDNLFFHTILFPALLIAHGDYILPYNVVVNEFVNLEGEKLSTSRGWVVWLHDLLKEYDPDVIRFYAAAIAPETRDTDFKWQDFAEKVNGELIGTYGNLIHRVLSFIYSRMGGVIPEPGSLEDRDREMLDLRGRCADRVAELIEACEFRKGLRAILEFAQEGNAYMNEKAPWRDVGSAGTALYVLAQLVFSLAVISAPYLPFSAQKILDYMNLDMRVEDLRWSDAVREIPPGHRINEPKPLFRKITAEEVRRKLSELESVRRR
ncbi:MAG TPA: methionine--tRNA ligase, partial [Nitrososphaeria archaeon]|nr:methionine--tRNA ligase [Nitrososphaeria archaeon]